MLSELYQAAAAEEADSVVLLLHFGVHRDGSYYLERNGTNWNEFRVVDEDGLQLVGRITETLEAKGLLTTNLDLSTLLVDLEKICPNLGLPIAISESAGSFVCNWVYTLSLLAAQRGEVLGQREKTQLASLFVHIPPWDSANLQQNLQVAVGLCRLLSQTLQQDE